MNRPHPTPHSTAGPAPRPARRLAPRLAWRMFRQDRSRTALAAALIALPVTVAVLVHVLYNTGIPGLDEERMAAMGSAQAMVHAQDGQDPPPSGDDLAAALPPSAVLVEIGGGHVPLTTPDGAVMVSSIRVDLREPLTGGLLEVTEGRAPERDGEVLVGARLAQARGVAVGDRLDLGGDRPGEVTGLVLDPSRFDREFVVALPADPVLPPPEHPYVSWLVGGLPDAEPGPALERLLPEHGFSVDPRSAGMPERGERGSAENDLAILLFTTLGLIEVGLLSGAVFVLCARRRRRELALLSAAGARPGFLLRTVLMHGLTVAGTGALGGAALGIGGALLAQPFGERLLGFSWGDPVIRPVPLLAIAALALATGLLAALWPALRASRDTPEALSSAAGHPSRRPWLWPAVALLGLGAMVGGGALRLVPVVFAGLPVFAAGLLLSCGLVLDAMAALSTHLPPRARVALRGPARRRSRFLPLAVAICAAMATASAVGVLLHSGDRDAALGYRPELLPGHAQVNGFPTADDAALDLVVDRLGGGSHTRLRQAVSAEDPETPMILDNEASRCFLSNPGAGANEHCAAMMGPGTPAVQFLAVADDTMLEAVFADQRDREEAARALARGRMVVTDPALLAGPGRAVIRPWGSQAPGAAGAGVEVPAHVVEAPGHSRLPAALIAPEPLAELGVDAVFQGTVLLVPEHRPTDERIDDAAIAVGTNLGWEAEFYVETGYDGWEIRYAMWLFTGLAAAVALGTAAMGAALATVENADDDRVLSAVGARPRFLRATSGARMAALVLPSALHGTLAGGTAMLLVVLAWGVWPALVPWGLLGGVLAAVAVLAWLVGLATAGAPRRTGRAPGPERRRSPG